MNRNSPNSSLWNPSNWYLAQTVHVLVGVLIVFAGATHGLYLPALLLVFVGLTGIKEFAIDVSEFEQASWNGSTQDFIAYQCGAICGLLALGHFWFGAFAASATILTLFVWDFCDQHNYVSL